MVNGKFSKTEPSKAAAVRELAVRGWKTADIARQLGIRYQHAYNALHRSTGERATPVEVRTRLREGGRIVIPASFRDALGLHEGDELVLKLGEEGEIQVLTPARMIREAQRIVRQHVSEGRSLADELIAERRGEAARE